MHVHIILGFWSISIFFMIISLLLTLLNVFKKARYGKVVFKVQSNKYRLGLNSNKELSMNVKPFKCNNTTYLPVRYVIKALGIKPEKNEEQKTIIKYHDKLITISENLILVCRTGENTYQKMENHIKYINNEMMVPLLYYEDMFDVNVNYNENTDEIVIW